MKFAGVLAVAAFCRVGVALRAKNATDDKIAAANQLVASLSASLKTSGGTHNATQPSHAAGHRIKVDVGFSDFQSSLLKLVEAKVRDAEKQSFNQQLLDRLVGNFTSAITAALKAELAPVKKSIGGTWMALPQDEQKNAFVKSTRSSFEPIFKDALSTMTSHLPLTLRRIDLLVKGRSANAALADKASDMLAEGIVKQHCYESPTLKEKAKNSTGNKTARHSKDPPGKFCIDSVISGFARRLKDSESLVGMGMRFEAGAMGGLSLLEIV